MEVSGQFHVPKSLDLRNKPSNHWKGGHLASRGIRKDFRKAKISRVWGFRTPERPAHAYYSKLHCWKISPSLFFFAFFSHSAFQVIIHHISTANTKLRHLMVLWSQSMQQFKAVSTGVPKTTVPIIKRNYILNLVEQKDAECSSFLYCLSNMQPT